MRRRPIEDGAIFFTKHGEINAFYYRRSQRQNKRYFSNRYSMISFRNCGDFFA